MRAEDETAFYNHADFGENCAFGADYFVGILDTADSLAFDAAPTTTHVLSYAPGPDLAAGDFGTVSWLRFKVARPPEQISATEMRVQLVRVPA